MVDEIRLSERRQRGGSICNDAVFQPGSHSRACASSTRRGARLVLPCSLFPLDSLHCYCFISLQPVFRMDFESDDEELPTSLDPPTSSIADNTNNTTSTFDSFTLPDRTVPKSEPPSPGTARKRTFEEILEKSQRPIPSTTPLKTPPKPSFDHKVSTFLYRSTPSQPEAYGLRQRPTASMSTSMPADALRPQGPEQDQKVNPRTFVDDVAAYQQHLEAEFKDYEKELESRDRSQELAALDWQELEDRYQKEISPKVADEQKIMEDFHAHFQVGLCSHCAEIAD